MRAAIMFALALGAGGCQVILGVDDPTLVPDGQGEGDAGLDEPRPGEARLGLPCGEAHRDNGFDGGCPGESVCVFDLGEFGSPGNDVGYCSPFCVDADPTACFEAYDGPPEGEPACGPPEIGAADICVIGLNSCAQLGDQACPPEMTCQPLFADVLGCVPIDWAAGGSDGGTFMNFLGQLCGPDYGACPPGHGCVPGIENFQDPAGNGYCTPDCTNDPALCSEGYTGPPEGNPMCVENPDPMVPSICVVGFGGGCDQAGNAACPGEMICHTFETPQGPLQGCGGPTWTAQPPQ